jgi:hypothetical protein
LLPAVSIWLLFLDLLGLLYLGEKLELWCSRINKASLKPRQKLVMLNQYAIGRLQFYLSQAETSQGKLLEMDLVCFQLSPFGSSFWICWDFYPEVVGIGVDFFRNTCFYFNEGDFITGLKLRTDTYPTKVTLARAGNPGGDVACRRCKAAPETVGHISGQCPAVKGYRINRHNGICGILSR